MFLICMVDNEKTGLECSFQKGVAIMSDSNLLEGKKILIVDDEPDILDALEELLSTVSYTHLTLPTN